jgi:hypothetical protein
MILKDPSDSRDLIFKAGTFPPSFDLKQYVTGIENQGHLQNCTNEATAAMVEMMLKKFKPAKYGEMSRTFAWWNARVIDGKEGQNVGVYTRSIMMALEKHGICYEKFWDAFLVTKKPSKEAFKQALKFKIKTYQRCTTQAEIANISVEDAEWMLR